MIFVVKQTVTHPLSPKVYEKKCHIVGRDLRHAISLIRARPETKKQLLKSSFGIQVDRHGRTLYIEIKEELKA